MAVCGTYFFSSFILRISSDRNLHLPCNYEHGRNKKRNDRRQVLFDDIFSMGTRTITVIEATRQTTPKLSFLSFHLCRKKSSTSYVIIRKNNFSKELRCCWANAIRNCWPAASLAAAALAGVSYSGWLLLVVGTCRVCRVTRTSI